MVALQIPNQASAGQSSPRTRRTPPAWPPVRVTIELESIRVEVGSEQPQDAHHARPAGFEGHQDQLGRCGRSMDPLRLPERSPAGRVGDTDPTDRSTTGGPGTQALHNKARSSLPDIAKGSESATRSVATRQEETIRSCSPINIRETGAPTPAAHWVRQTPAKPTVVSERG